MIGFGNDRSLCFDAALQQGSLSVRRSRTGDLMEKHDRTQGIAHQPLKGGNLLVLGLWMRSAIAGAAFAAAGIAALINPGHGVSLAMALTWIAAGGTCAWFARRRAIALLDGLDLNPPARLERDDAPRMPSTARAPASS
jgi:hypothetical protein